MPKLRLPVSARRAHGRSRGSASATLHADWRGRREGRRAGLTRPPMAMGSPAWSLPVSMSVREAGQPLGQVCGGSRQVAHASAGDVLFVQVVLFRKVLLSSVRVVMTNSNALAWSEDPWNLRLFLSHVVASGQIPRWESNPHGHSRPEDFKSSASAIPPRGPDDLQRQLKSGARIGQRQKPQIAKPKPWDWKCHVPGYDGVG